MDGPVLNGDGSTRAARWAARDGAWRAVAVQLGEQRRGGIHPRMPVPYFYGFANRQTAP